MRALVILVLVFGCSGGEAFEAAKDGSTGEAGETGGGGSAGEPNETGGSENGGRTGGTGGTSSGSAGEPATGGNAGDGAASGGNETGGRGGSATETGGSGGCAPTTFYADDDGDGFGDEDETAEVCEAPDGFVVDAGDCDDLDSAIHPGAEELCNGYEMNCNHADGNGCPDGCEGLGSSARCSVPSDWAAAAATCESIGMVLAASRDQVGGANQSMTGLAPFWIGASDIENEGDWVWPDGSEVIGGPWAASEPSADSDDDDCGVSSGITGPGQWSSLPCSTELPFACYLAPAP